jgi:hypothetical protein
VLFVLTIGLSGCFVSKNELITADSADFPFTTMTYVEENSKKTNTLKREGNKYMALGQKDQVYIRLNKINKDAYIGQMAMTDNGKSVYLFALLRFSDDRKSFTLSKAVADKDDIAAVKNGGTGLSICEDDTVCIPSLKAFAKYALQPHPKDKAIIHQILAIE